MDSVAVENEIIPLSIDTNSLSPLSLTNANPIPLQENVIPSLEVAGTATIKTPNVTAILAKKSFWLL